MGFIEFHKKHHTVLMVIESIVLSIILFLVSLFCYKTDYIYNEEEMIVLNETNIYSFSNLNFVTITQNICSIVLLIFIFVIIFIRDKKQNPIFAKKLTHILFSISVGVLVFDMLMYIAFNDSVIINNEVYTFIEYTFSRIISLICHVLMSFLIYVWRSEFSLEKFYGSR